MLCEQVLRMQCAKLKEMLQRSNYEPTIMISITIIAKELGINDLMACVEMNPSSTISFTIQNTDFLRKDLSGNSS